MKLYHGTSYRNLQQIIKTKSIVPRKGDGNWKHTLKSNPEMVYLTNCYGCYFAFNSTYHLADESIPDGEYDANNYDDDKAVVLEIDVSPKNLYPDEDALEQVSRLDNDLNKHIKQFMSDYDDSIDYMADRTNFFIDNYEQYKDLWKTSLDALGTVCHKGKIHINHIKRVAVLHPHAFLYSQPTITIANYRYKGADYRKECSELIWSKEYSSKVIKNKDFK